MDSHDITMLQLALDTAILEAEKAVKETPTDAYEYPGYVYAMNEFKRLRKEIK